MQQYTILSNLKHNGVSYAAGASILLDEQAAAPLLAAGAIKVPEAPAVAQVKQADGFPIHDEPQAPQATATSAPAPAPTSAPQAPAAPEAPADSAPLEQPKPAQPSSAPSPAPSSSAAKQPTPEQIAQDVAGI